MTTPSPPWALRALNLVLVLGLLWGLLQAVLYAGYLTGYRFQAESREGAQLRSAMALAEDRNPWSPRHAVQDYNCYGLLFPWTAAKLLPRSALSLGAMRALSLAALALGGLLLGVVAARLAGSRMAGAAAGLAAFGGYLFFVTPSARSDGFAALFFIAPLAVAYLWKAPAGLALAALLGALAFFTKPYAAVGVPALCLVLAGQGRWKAAFATSGFWTLLLIASVAVVQGQWPGYLESTLLLHANAADPSISHLRLQTSTYFTKAGWPLLLLAGAALVRWRQPRPTAAWALPAAGMLLLLLGWLGWHRGAYLQYYFQLLHPTVLLAVAALWAHRPRGERWLEAGLALCAVLSVSFGTVFMPRFMNVKLEPWRHAQQMVAASQAPLVPGLWTSLLTAHGKPVYNNGQTEYLHLAGKGASGSALHAAALSNAAAQEQGLSEGRFDLVAVPAVDPWPEAVLRHYDRQGLLCLPALLHLSPAVECFDIYLPRPSGPKLTVKPGL